MAAWYGLMPLERVDHEHMARALELAQRGEGYVEPNPPVGCVIARGPTRLAEGWHRQFGGPHAEIDALRQLDSAARPDKAALGETTLFVTLEPCCHTGKTPPCTDAILASGIRRVVIAVEDPFAQVNGRGIDRLQGAGIRVEVGCQAAAATELLRPYLKRIKTGLPWVIAKWAMTLDGKIASRTGDSQWISGPASREVVHRLRGRMDAILIGRATALHDNPRLTARPPGPRTATRVVIDSAATLPLAAHLVQSSAEAPVLIVSSAEATTDRDSKARVSQLEAAGCEVWRMDGDPHDLPLDHLLSELGRREMTNVLCEGGGELLGKLHDQRLIDEVHVFVAPCLLGGAGAITPLAGLGTETVAAALRIESPKSRVLDQDLYITGRVSTADVAE